MCGFLASCVGLAQPGAAMSPTDLLADFDPGRVSALDTLVAWTGEQLVTSLAP
ncbi:MAG: hypothetical protein ACI9OJ_003261 [Myxococcota bacterium]